MIGFDASVVSIEWLENNLDQPDLVVLDATIPKAGSTEQKDDRDLTGIPTTRVFDLKAKFIDKMSPLPNTLPDKDQFETEARQLGLNQSSYIIIYDQHGIYSSARAWWMFKSMGHDKVAVLDGGLPRWNKANLPVTDIVSYTGKKGNFVAHFHSEKFCGVEAILNNMNSHESVILDARAEDRYLGTKPESREGLRSGHIPFSKNLHYAKLQNDGLMKPRKYLLELLEEQNPDNKPLIMSCGSGVTACIVALAAHMCDYENVTVYDGSWSEWGANVDLPIS